jgi:hypothetical protein
MANTFILGGSPLGLIGVSSRPSRDGMSTFNGGKSRNVNVSSYNTGKKQTTNIKGKDGKPINASVSLFTGGSLPNFWPNIGKTGTDSDTTGSKDPYKGIDRNILHNNDIYDTSILNIIEKLSFSNRAALRPQDFAYLKNIGLFPNNRLMIARRFAEPQKENIMTKGGGRPLSVLISWKPEDEDFLDFTFGEIWTDAEADFTNILNKLGDDFKIGGLGVGLGKGINAVPLPGFTEVIQRKFLERVGILEDQRGIGLVTPPLPSGNPNIIKVAKRRQTIGYGVAGSGLKCDINIKMKVEYEQKFISGIDPTIAWMDILNNVLVFGTSNSDNYGLSKKFSEKINQWTSPGGIEILIGDIVDTIRENIDDIKKGITEAISQAASALGVGGGAQSTPGVDLEGLGKEALDFVQDFQNLLLSTLQETLRKYKVELMGISHALSGAPSTPWHITIGNPLRPVFCSGDMLVESVELKLGSTLAFNDLPSNITVDFTLKNARPLGMQEILAKFNTGHLRTVNVRKDFTVSSQSGSTYYDTPEGADTVIEEVGENPGSNSDSNQPLTPQTSKENAPTTT